MIAVVVSRADGASERIGEHLLDLADWTEHADATRPDGDGGGTYYRTDGFELRTFDDLHLHIEGASRAFGDGDATPDLLVFASRHSGDTGPLLTAHSTGNFGPAEYGGRAGELAEAAPNALARLLAAFDDHAPAGYDTGLECTHHGPSRVGCPSLFAELGSGPDEWDDPEGARAVARGVLALRGVDPGRERTVVGFGGGHYVPRFERVVRETDWAVGHIGADWALAEAGDPPDRSVLARAFERSGATRALLDGDHPALERILADLGYEVVSETWVRETTGVDLDLVGRVEDALGSVDAGVRFGDPAGDVAGGFALASLPGDLLAEANGIDRERVRALVGEHAVAFDTAEGGTRVASGVALPEPTDHDALVDALADVLRAKYDEVEHRGDAVLARREAFDPARARELGVEEGPAFGKLADGDPVEVAGREIHPGDVSTVEEVRFPV